MTHPAINPYRGSTFGELTIATISSRAVDGFDIIIQLLAVMAVVIALVGGVGLSGVLSLSVLSLSVLERRREIGVMRAIGASSWQVLGLFIGERPQGFFLQNVGRFRDKTLGV